MHWKIKSWWSCLAKLLALFFLVCFFLFVLGVVCSCCFVSGYFRSRFQWHRESSLAPVVENLQVNVKLNPHPLSPLWPDSSNKTGYGMLGPYDAWLTGSCLRLVSWTNSRVSRWWLDLNGGGFFYRQTGDFFFLCGAERLQRLEVGIYFPALFFWNCYQWEKHNTP